VTSTLYAVPMAREDPPRYRQIAADLRARMESGEYPPDSRLPSKNEMMDRYGVALATVNRAIDELRKLGLVETIHGVGTFARKPAEPGPSEEYREMAAQIRLLGERMDAAEAWIAEQEARGG
jgi:DNA-binding GntR family transcriptional regulator